MAIDLTRLSEPSARSATWSAQRRFAIAAACFPARSWSPPGVGALTVEPGTRPDVASRPVPGLQRQGERAAFFSQGARRWLIFLAPSAVSEGGVTAGRSWPRQIWPVTPGRMRGDVDDRDKRWADGATLRRVRPVWIVGCGHPALPGRR